MNPPSVSVFASARSELDQDRSSLGEGLKPWKAKNASFRSRAIRFCIVRSTNSCVGPAYSSGIAPPLHPPCDEPTGRG